LTFREIEAEAERIALEKKFDRENETIVEFAERLGGAVRVLSRPSVEELESGSLIVRAPKDFVIYLSPTTGVLRDNFTVAHELGHYFLHTGSPPGTVPLIIGRYGSNPVEQQANRFAAGLLMPRGDFITTAQRTNNNCPILAGRFGVSLAAVDARLRSLGMISE